jgi:hypothetical protein
MRKILFSLLVLFVGTTTYAQDISVKKLPKEVKTVLEEYVNILTTSKDLDDCANRFATIAGGALINEDGETLGRSVKPFSLKKDFNDVKHYKNPIKITRVNVSKTRGTGYGATKIAGTVYKCWIDKKSKDLGMPAPITIIVAEGHETINTPKVTGIGSL